MEVLVFELAGCRYGLPLDDVAELPRAVSVAPLPKAPAIVEGLINLRGALAPVLDIRTRFRHPPKPADPADHLVVAQAGGRRVALLVDRAVGLVTVEDREIEDACLLVPGAEYVAGVAKLPEGIVIIHDLRTFLSELESGQLDEALNGPGLGGSG